MTSASELFYNRRLRLGRDDQDLGSYPSSDRSFHKNYNRRHHRHTHRNDLDGGDPFRRPQTARLSPRASHYERASVRLDQGTSQFTSSNNVNIETLSRMRRLSSNGNERLPGTVLLARARLLERLRGVSASQNSRSSRASSEISRRDSLIVDDLRLVDAGDWGTDNSLGQSSPFTDLNIQMERSQLLQQQKPPGLNQEALDNLHMEVYSCTETDTEGRVSSASSDCSICLESFMENDVLVSLPCGHRFHSSCLNPWVRTRGDCPYCRRSILLGKESHTCEINTISS